MKKEVKVSLDQVVTIHGLDYKVVDCEWDNEISLELVDPGQGNGTKFGPGGLYVICSIVGLQPYL